MTAAEFLKAGTDRRRVLNYLTWRCRDVGQFYRNCNAYRRIKRESRTPHAGEPHGAGSPVVVSLASYRPRFRTLPLTLECLLRQSARPDRIVVWIHEGDARFVTPEMRALEARGVAYRTVAENLRSFNKIIPALAADPGAIIVTVDDDMYYRPTMLAELLGAWSGCSKEIVCHYAVRIGVDPAGRRTPFKQWGGVRGAYFPGYDIMPFGFGGVLYPPGALPPRTLDSDTFRRLCPSGDDIWLWWMARLNGCTYRKVARDTEALEWPFSQRAGLKHANMSVENQKQIDRMAEAFGWPSFDEP